MDPQFLPLLQQMHETLQALAWHQQVTSYLLMALSAFMVLGLYAIIRDTRAIAQMTREALRRLPPPAP